MVLARKGATDIINKILELPEVLRPATKNSEDQIFKTLKLIANDCFECDVIGHFQELD